MTRNDPPLAVLDDDAQCPECRSTQLRRDDQRGELVCARCGLVLQEGAIDPGPEWRSFDRAQHEKRARTGAPSTLLLHDKGLSTEIGWSDKDGAGRRIPAGSRALYYRLRKWQRRVRTRSGVERNLVVALSELDRMASRLGLPRNVRETAALIHRRAVDKGVLRGRSIEGVAVASLYAACRQCGVPRTLDELSEASRVSRKVAGRTYRVLARELKLKLGPTTPLDYIPRFGSKLELGPATQALAGKLLRDAAQKGLTNGKAPAGMAAAALYIAGILQGEPRTQKDIGAAAGVTEVTIRNHYQLLAGKLEVPTGAPGHPGVPLSRTLRDLQKEPEAQQRPRPLQREAAQAAEA